MRFFADHCFFSCGIQFFKENGHDILTAKEAGLAACRDEDIVTFCRNEKRIILTLDTDFSNLYRFPLGTHAGVVVFRPDPFTPEKLLQSLESLRQKNLFDQLADSLTIVRENKIRILRPGGPTQTV